MLTSLQSALQSHQQQEITKSYQDENGNVLELTTNTKLNTLTAVLNGHKMQLRNVLETKASLYQNGEFSLLINKNSIEFCRASKIIFSI